MEADDTGAGGSFRDEGPHGCQVVDRHGGPADRAGVERRRSFWRKRPDALRSPLEG